MCPVFTCSLLIISYWLLVFNKSLNQLLTIVYFIYSVLVVKWEIHFFLIKIHKLTMCKIHCIVRDMSSSIISVSLLTIYLKRATCICVLSVRNNQVCLFFTTYIAITCTMYILYQPSLGFIWLNVMCISGLVFFSLPDQTILFWINKWYKHLSFGCLKVCYIVKKQVLSNWFIYKGKQTVQILNHS